MKNSLFSPIAALIFFAISSTSVAQFSFGIESFCSTEKDFAKVTVPASVFGDLIRGSNQGITDKDACLDTKLIGQLEGYQADYDGDGNAEMFLLYHTGSADGGCNALAVLSTVGGGSYELYDLLTLPAGKAIIRPIVTLNEGVQMYLQNTYTLPDGTPETKGSILGLKQKAIVILISWTQKNSVVEGKHILQEARVAFVDLNFDDRKEMLIQYTTYDGKVSDKNLSDKYLLTLDYVPSQLRYGVYDSAGYDKVREAKPMAASGERMMHRESTFIDGVVKIREALRLDPFMTSTRVKLGNFFLNDGKYGDAEKEFLAAVQYDKYYAKAYKLLGDTYLRLNKLQSSLAAYTTFLQLDPKSRDTKKVEHNIKQITIPKAR